MESSAQGVAGEMDRIETADLEDQGKESDSESGSSFSVQ